MVTWLIVMKVAYLVSKWCIGTRARKRIRRRGEVDNHNAWAGAVI